MDVLREVFRNDNLIDSLTPGRVCGPAGDDQVPDRVSFSEKCSLN